MDAEVVLNDDLSFNGEIENAKISGMKSCIVLGNEILSSKLLHSNTLPIASSESLDAEKSTLGLADTSNL